MKHVTSTHILLWESHHVGIPNYKEEKEMLSCFMSRKKRDKTHLSESTGCLCPTSHPCNTKQRHALRLVQSALADEKIELNFNFNLMVNILKISVEERILSWSWRKSRSLIERDLNNYNWWCHKPGDNVGKRKNKCLCLGLCVYISEIILITSFFWFSWTPSISN